MTAYRKFLENLALQLTSAIATKQKLKLMYRVVFNLFKSIDRCLLT